MSSSLSILWKLALNPLLLITKQFHSQSHPHLLPSQSPFSLIDLLYDCNSKSLTHGLYTHSPLIKLGLQAHTLISNLLLSLYSKCKKTHLARKLFDEMPHRDIVSWTGIISSYVNTGAHGTALELFGQMVLSGLNPNQFTYATMIRCASSAGGFDLGTCIHARILKRGFESNVVLSSAMLDFYAKCDELEDALRMFSEMEGTDTVSWTVMISALVEAGEWSEALRMFMDMIVNGVSPNEFTFVKILLACRFLRLHYGELVHGQLIVRGVDLNLVLKTALVDMYAKCRRMRNALKVLNQTSDSDVMLWTTIIFGYAQDADCKLAIETLREMEIAGVLPNSFTYSAVLNACVSCSALQLGMQTHSRVFKVGVEGDLSVGNALVDLYSKLSSNLNDSIRAFGELHYLDSFSWTTLISGLLRHNQVNEAFTAFTEMRATGIAPDSYTLSTILKSGGYSTEALAHAMAIHAYVLKTNVDAWDVQLIIGNSLVDAYTRLKRIDDAWNVAYMMMPHRDIFTYTSLAKGLNQLGLHKKALDIIIPIMHDDDVRIDGFSLATFVSATSGLAAIEAGKQLHCLSLKSGLNNWVSVSNGLIDMYSKCGFIEEARKTFALIPEPNVASWNGLISGYSSNARFTEALSAFEDMRLAGVQPDNITMLVVLYACSHGGLVDLGVKYFKSMTEMFGLSPQLDHYVCLVDLLGRAGRLEEAAWVIETMSFKPNDPLIYKTLLHCCKLHRNLAMGEIMARRVMEMDPGDPAVYVMLATMYDDAGKSQMGEMTREMMRERGLNKFPGQSWVETRNVA
ncbi:uncharacterized protein A4U43_C01F35700 [Asparagus officinalis]|uniref:Pentacotripeptide-repeat region of PRORP domain-containing protein n=1 Tax=Asparagus officinalis TaxID=4686 RepID=A0A5P1FX61_ASPOF|nr:pentatricopeptide repeat-containing protein At5g52850, chloroplastic-like [Asparagus officinalis]ONK82059.1 uncharacterized protein A4U43_C01F35700 [Asparagus officinalis]